MLAAGCGWLVRDGQHADERIIRAGIGEGFDARNAMGGKERNGKARRDRGIRSPPNRDRWRVA